MPDTTSHPPRKRHNVSIHHAAISCTDLEALVAWYKDIFGFEQIDLVRPSYPSSLQESKLAILTSGNGVGIECFQFIAPAPRLREQAFEYTRAGYFHICVTGSDPDALVARIREKGGRVMGDTMDFSPYGLTGHQDIYTQDPWGKVVEVMSLSSSVSPLLERLWLDDSTGECRISAVCYAAATAVRDCDRNQGDHTDWP